MTAKYKPCQRRMSSPSGLIQLGTGRRGIWHLMTPLIIPYEILTEMDLRRPGSEKVAQDGFERQRPRVNKER